MVAISPDTPPRDENAIIEGVKEWITQGNKKLHAATGERVAIGQVSILIPSSWTNVDANTTARTTFEVEKVDGCRFNWLKLRYLLNFPIEISHTGKTQKK